LKFGESEIESFTAIRCNKE